MHITTPALICVIVAFLATAAPCAARQRHHHRYLRTTEGITAPQRDPRAFYPEKIEGGVSGNLPFNNQIRKMRDPLNANGAGG